MTANQTVKILSGAAKGDIYKYVGTSALSSPNLKTQDYTDTTKWVQVGSTNAGETLAYVSSSSLVAGTTLTQTATSGETIHATVVAAAVALAGGGIVSPDAAVCVSVPATRLELET